MKRFLLPVLLLLSAPLFALGYLLISFAEPQGIQLSALSTRLFIPSNIRALPIIDPCDEPLASRKWMECGGICGVFYRVSYRSRSSEDDLKASFNVYRDVLADFRSEINVGTPESYSGDLCRLVQFEIWRDTRTKSAR